MKKLLKLVRESISVRSMTGLVILILLITYIVGMIGYRGFTDSLLTEFGDSAFRIAKSASSMMTPDRVENYLETGEETEDYKAVRANLRRLCNAAGATFIYVIIPDEDYNHITFVMSTMNDNAADYPEYGFGYYRETTNNDYKLKYRALYEQISFQELVIRDRGYIETDPHITAMLPLIGNDGVTKGILCVQMQMDYLATVRNQYISKVVQALIAVLFIVITGLSFYLHRNMIFPLEVITKEAERFAKENVAPEQKLAHRISNVDEIGKLAVSIDKMEEQIEQYVNDLTVITAERERIGAELGLATRIQQDMLPNTYPAFPDRKEFDIYASMDPARGVGGDFYDYFFTDNDHLCFLMADVSGKGVPAALFMMASMIIITNSAKMLKKPSEILANTNRAICSRNREEMFVTVWLGILEISTGKLQASNAGHEYPVLQRAGEKFELIKDRHGFVIGGMEGMKYQDYEIELHPGDKLFLYTDGLPEATDTSERMFGTERMLEALNEVPEETPEKVLKHITESVESFVKDAEQFDDLTMLCLEYKGTNG